MPKVFIPRERHSGETRVAATPETVKKLIKRGLEVIVESGAGVSASFDDAAYEAAGATVGGDLTELWSSADLVLKITPLTDNADLGKPEYEAVREGALVTSLLAPHQNLEMVKSFAERKVSSLAMELVPRISRAQSMDALSSQASIAGYKAVLLVAHRLDKYFPLLMTAAGTIAPARVVIMGAGVAGLQAIATAKRLGAVIEVSDIRPAVKEQVESLGGKFIDLPMEETGEGKGGYAKEMTPEFLAKQREIVAERVSHADAVITTALVPGRKAPTLVTQEMVESMRPGAVIVDLAVAQGGNCVLSEPEKEVVHQGVRILGPSNLPAAMPSDASTLYARNVLALLDEVLEEGEVKIDLENDVIQGALLTHDGTIRHAPTAKMIEETAS